ncbi:MAG: helix-turn-helix domain-containing protein [Paludibacteraceae bacterium]|nr:helix-turn-helix domain-containing protein [Paludibacteraceae bacterium]
MEVKVDGLSPENMEGHYKIENHSEEPLDYISGEEVMQIYRVKKSWLYTSAKRNEIPIFRIAGKNYYSRKHMNELFELTFDADSIKEWVTTEQVLQLYGMNSGSIHSYAYRHHIPTKREYGITYYSKDHLDELRRTDFISDGRYYTTAEVAENTVCQQPMLV